MIRLVKYNQSFKDIWNSFVAESKNGTFMLNRNYVEYHSDRFADNSLLFFQGNSLMAVLPASAHDKEVRSHGGLTYGGFITGKKMTAQCMLEVMEACLSFLQREGFTSLVYKRVPYIYYSYPSDEDLYALFRFDAILSKRDISTAVLMNNRMRFSERRRRNLKKAINAGLRFMQTDDYHAYMELLSEVLASRHGAKPVHTVEEIERLSTLFPDNIKLYATFNGERMLAGTIIYETNKVAHAQYIASSTEGRQLGALDLIFNQLITEVYSDITYFDFGTSNENKGRFLNEGLIEQKQEFGARAVAYDEYKILL